MFSATKASARTSSLAVRRFMSTGKDVKFGDSVSGQRTQPTQQISTRGFQEIELQVELLWFKTIIDPLRALL